MKPATRERLGAATGLAAAALFGISFIIGLSPEPPDLDAGPTAVGSFVRANADALQVGVLLNVLAMLLFLWFLGSIRSVLRRAEGQPGRLSAIAMGGALVGTTFVILANIFMAAAALHPEFLDDGAIQTLVDLQQLCIGIGAAAFAVFFIGVAAITLMDGGLPDILGWLALAAGVLALIGVVSVFNDSGVFAADGAFGFWVRYAAFVVFIGAASLWLILGPQSRRR